MTQAEWDALCDRCGKCCYHKMPGGEVTAIPCKLLDLQTRLCSKYETRKDHVPECVTLTPAVVATADWLPDTCAYRQ
jgi:uncharacterized protein